MATISSAIKLEDKMSQTFKNINKAAQDANKTFSNVEISVKHIDERMKAANKTSSSFFSGLLKFNVLSSVFSMITSQLSSAISRFDTLQNYTKVMSNLGISEEEANASRERLKQGLKGLPTTLDSAALAVQRFASANNNVEASTEMYLAMNNALLAGGASMDIQRSAMEQLAQAYAKGKPDMMEWRALLQAMPGQLQQIAKAMGKTTTELGEDLRSDKTSMNEFMKTAIQLNQEGIDGFQSFAEQAENSTGGIQTAIANMEAAIARGWEGMIEQANKSLEASGLPTIQQMIANTGAAIEETMNSLGETIIPEFVAMFEDLGNIFNQLDADIGDATNHALQGMTVIDFFTIGLKGLIFGLDVAYNAIKAVCIAIKVAFLQVFADTNEVANNIIHGVADLIANTAGGITDFLNGVIDGLNALLTAFNNTFSFLGANVPMLERINRDLVTSRINEAAEGSLRDTLAKDGFTILNDAELGMAKEWAQAAQNELVEFSLETSARWDRESAELEDLVNKLQNAAQQTDGTASDRAGNYDYNLLDKLSNNVIGTDSTGGSAVKTTTNDDLLKDEDIQLLLDVATRDYKLTYQQVTPNITLTFGDIRETVDVDEVLDVVADRLEEIYDSNLEVTPV